MWSNQLKIQQPNQLSIKISKTVPYLCQYSLGRLDCFLYLVNPFKITGSSIREKITKYFVQNGHLTQIRALKTHGTECHGLNFSTLIKVSFLKTKFFERLKKLKIKYLKNSDLEKLNLEISCLLSSMNFKNTIFAYKSHVFYTTKSHEFA